MNLDSSHYPGTGRSVTHCYNASTYLCDGVEGSFGHKEFMLSPAQHGTHTGKDLIQNIWMVGRQKSSSLIVTAGMGSAGYGTLNLCPLGHQERSSNTLMQGENHCVAVKRKTEAALGKQGNICHSFRKQQGRTCRVAKCLSKVPGGEGINVFSGTCSNFPSHCGKPTVVMTCFVIVINI